MKHVFRLGSNMTAVFTDFKDVSDTRVDRITIQEVRGPEIFIG